MARSARRVLTHLVAAHLTAACAGGPRSTRTEATAKDDLVYTIALASGPTVDVTVTTVGGASGVTRFSLEDGWGGVDKPGDEIDLVAARGPDAEALAVERVAISSWQVRHAPALPLTLRYRVVPTRRTADPMREAYRAIVSPELVSLMGATALLMPDSLGAPKRRIRLRASGFTEAGWRFVSSFGLGPELRIEQNADRLRHSVFLAAPDLRIVTGTEPSAPVVAITGRWSFPDAAFAARIARVSTAAERLFAHPAPLYFLVTLAPRGPAHTSGFRFRGTGLTSSFATFLSPGASLEGSHGRFLTKLLAHETVHGWNGSAYVNRDRDETMT